VEAHLLTSFTDDFYGAHLRLAVTGYLRDEAPFASLDALIDAIRTDIRLARESLAAGGAFALDAASTDFLAAAAPQRVESAGSDREGKM
jgi:riboflavin kinase